MANKFVFNPFTQKLDIVPASISTVGTEATILALTPTAGNIAYGTDTQFFYVADGTNWRRASLKFYTDSANPDAGAEQNNPKDGYWSDMINDKVLANVSFGNNASTNEGGIWVDNTVTPKKFYIRLNSINNTILYDLSMTLGYLVGYQFQTAQAVKIWSGMSVDTPQGESPSINEYKISAGAEPARRIINPGGFE